MFYSGSDKDFFKFTPSAPMLVSLNVSVSVEMYLTESSTFSNYIAYESNMSYNNHNNYFLLNPVTNCFRIEANTNGVSYYTISITSLNVSELSDYLVHVDCEEGTRYVERHLTSSSVTQKAQYKPTSITSEITSQSDLINENYNFCDGPIGSGIYPIHNYLNDDRLKIENTKSFPYSAVCMYGGSSGALVDDNIMFTAAHCITWLDRGTGMQVFQNNQVIPGQNSSVHSFGSFSTTDLYVVASRFLSRTVSNDWGIVVCEETLNQYDPSDPYKLLPGYFGMLAIDESQSSASVNGYPATATNTFNQPTGYQWMASGSVMYNYNMDNINSNINYGSYLYYYIDQTGGNSGGPVYASINNAYYLIGAVHGTVNYDGGNYNGAKAVTSRILEIVTLLG